MGNVNILAQCTSVISKVQTLIDGTVRVSLDLGAEDIDQINKLLSHKINSNSPLIITFCKVDTDKKEYYD